MNEDRSSADKEGNRMRVLLVEDDATTLAVVRKLLVQCGYEVQTAENGRQAMDALERGQPRFDLVLTDVLMPEVGGTEVLERIAEEERWRQIPVVMMSSSDAQETVMKCFRLGAADFLVKPVRANELRNLWRHVWCRSDVKRQESQSKGSGVGSEEPSKASVRPKEVEDGGSRDGRRGTRSDGTDSLEDEEKNDQGGTESRLLRDQELVEDLRRETGTETVPVLEFNIPVVQDGKDRSLRHSNSCSAFTAFMPNYERMVRMEQGEREDEGEDPGALRAQWDAAALEMTTQFYSALRSVVDQQRRQLQEGGSENSAKSRVRAAAVDRFRQKRKERNFKKKVRYQSRKRLAEARPRIRGQFVKKEELAAYRAAEAESERTGTPIEELFQRGKGQATATR